MPWTQRINHIMDQAGNWAVILFHKLALTAIGAATVWAAAHTFGEMVAQPRATIGDLLLLFIYLEIGAMVGIYFRTNHMPVRFLLYIAITALTRHMVDIMSHAPINVIEMLAVASAVLVFSVSVMTIRFTSHRFPGPKNDDIV